MSKEEAQPPKLPVLNAIAILLLFGKGDPGDTEPHTGNL